MDLSIAPQIIPILVKEVVGAAWFIFSTVVAEGWMGC
jgi:hypothetical protein